MGVREGVRHVPEFAGMIPNDDRTERETEGGLKWRTLIWQYSGASEFLRWHASSCAGCICTGAATRIAFAVVFAIRGGDPGRK